MDALRLRLFALTQYRYAPYLLTALVVLLSSAGLDAHDGGEGGWSWWPPLFTNCYVHPGENCSWIRLEM